MPNPTRTRLFRTATVAFLVLCAGCSTDAAPIASGDAGASSGGSTSTGGSTSSGGASGAGGSVSTGGAETFDAAAAASCHADAGGEQCTLCLETLCCSDFMACVHDATCLKAYETYRSCILDPAQMDQPKCLSTFVRTGDGDAGHQGLYSCIFIGGCGTCGGVSPL